MLPRPLTPDSGRRTVCVSTQVGCKLGCAFCYTGRLRFKRNLAWHEIAAQVLAVRHYLGSYKSQGESPKSDSAPDFAISPSPFPLVSQNLGSHKSQGENSKSEAAPDFAISPSPFPLVSQSLGSHKSQGESPKSGSAPDFAISTSTFPLVTNVVFMGMGEPFLNFDATIEAARTINAESGLGIGARRITISTSGIPDGIRAFTQVPQQFRLALSLNASDDETRSKLMPVNKIHPLKEVMAAIRVYTDARGKRVTFEYVLVDGVNNRDRDVKQLAVLLKGIPCKLNLIPLNPFPGCELQAPTPESVEAFARKLWPLVPAVIVRRSKGASILAGCGQLAGLTD